MSFLNQLSGQALTNLFRRYQWQQIGAVTNSATTSPWQTTTVYDETGYMNAVSEKKAVEPIMVEPRPTVKAAWRD